MGLKFCISVPVGAYHPFLEYSLASLAAQIERADGYEIEAALLDASGDPRVKEVADKFDGLLSFRRHGPDAGQSDAILEGWAACSGDILGWLNADDILFPDALSKLAPIFLENSDIDVLYGHSTIIDEDFRTRGYHWAVEPPGPRLLQAGIISQPSCFFRRPAYDRAGGLNRDLHYTMDWDLWIRMYQSGAKFKFIDETLSMVLWADATKTASFNKARRQEINSIIRRNLDDKKRRRVFLSFAVHFLLEKIWPDELKRLVSQTLIRGRNIIHGVSGDGEIRNGASIHLAHYAPAPKTSAIIAADNADAIKDIASDAKIESLSRSKNKIHVAFAKPVDPAKTINFTFSTQSQECPRLRWVSWG